MSAMSGQNISFMEHCGKLHKKKQKYEEKTAAHMTSFHTLGPLVFHLSLLY